MKKLSFITQSFLIIAIAGLVACNKSTDDTATPVLNTTDVVIDAAGTTAYSGGILSSTSAATAYGVCYSSTNHEPTTADSTKSVAVTYSSFSNTIPYLLPNTTYYLRAYATYLTKTGYGEVIQFNTGSNLSATFGQVSTYAGSLAGGLSNGPLLTAQFDNPMGIAADAAGNLYIADSFNCAIRKISTGGAVTTVAGSGSLGYANGTGNAAQFYSPSALVVDATGNIFVADRGNNAIRKITPSGVVTTFAGNGTAGYTDGTGEAASFNTPSGIAIDPSGNLVIADAGNNLIRKITPAGVVTTVAGSRTAGYLNGTGTAANFNKPAAVAIDAAGNIYVTEATNSAIRKINADLLVTTFAGGPGINSLLGSPNALSIDASGNFWISDGSGRILKINTDKKLLVMAGTSGTTGATDGAGNVALFNGPTGVLATSSGVYVADFGNNEIRKIN
ncbi:hypothetical protein A0256_09775 [Mucilaginibacter sp. PAMC 26640]|nr:hypothetical protein A0256_09775 [Mucilaginibacter sp. PAMC 26640]